MELFGQAVELIHGWLLTVSNLLDGLGVPKWVPISVPFLLPALFAILSMRVLVVFAVLIATSSALAALWFLQIPQDWALMLYASGCVVALLVSLDAFWLNSSKSAMEKRLGQQDVELSQTRVALSREKLWRRAGGDDRPLLLDAEIVALAERVTKAVNESRLTVPVAPRPVADKMAENAVSATEPMSS